MLRAQQDPIRKVKVKIKAYDFDSSTDLLRLGRNLWMHLVEEMKKLGLKPNRDAILRLIKSVFPALAHEVRMTLKFTFC